MAFPQTSVSQTQGGPFAGMLSSSHPDQSDSYVSEEASAEIPFGTMVKQGTAENGALKCTATSNVLAGIVVHSHGYAKDTELGSTGLKPKVNLRLLQKGRVWVPVEEAVVPGDAVRVRVVAGGGETAGAFRKAADSTDCIDISKFARWITGGSSVAELEIDLSNRASGVADT